MGIEWVVSYFRLCWMDRIVSTGPFRWIVSYRIISAGSGNTGFYALAGYCLDGTDGTDGLNGALVGRRWDGRTLAPAGTGAPPWAPEQERPRWLLRGGGLCEVIAGTNCVGAARTHSIFAGEAK